MRVGQKWFVALDGKLGESFDGIGGGLVFSPDSQHLAYMGLRQGKWYAVVGSRLEGPYDGLGEHSLCFSPDGKHHAYTARFGDQQSVIRDGRPLNTYQAILQYTPRFSPDSRHLVYGGIMGRETRLVTDDRDGPFHDSILTTSAGGAFVCESTKRLHYIARQDNDLCLVTVPFDKSPLLFTASPRLAAERPQLPERPLGLARLAEEADLVFKGTVLSTTRLTNSALRLKEMLPRVTQLRVVSVITGSLSTNLVVFEHNSAPPAGWGGGAPPPHYHFELLRARKVLLGICRESGQIGHVLFSRAESPSGPG